MMQKKNFSSFIKPWFIWGLGASFFFTEYFARVAPSVMAPDLMRTFHATAWELGGLSAFFYYPYIFMQIPVGSILDRFGPHLVLTGAAAVCAFGAFIFVVSHNIYLANLARFVMGFGASFAFVGALKLATIWFETKRLGLLAGLTQGLGMLGAAIGVGVFAVVVTHYGWRNTMAIIGVILLILSMLILLFVRDRNKTSLKVQAFTKVKSLGIRDGLLIVFRNRYGWINAIFAGLIYAPTGAFAELWGPSFLHRTYGLSHDDAAFAVSIVFIGLGVGSPIVGWLSDTVGQRLPVMFLSAFFSLILMSVVLYIPHLPIGLLYILLFFYGIANTGVAVAYAVAGEINPAKVTGVSVAFTNMSSIFVAALLQPIIGFLLDLRWTGHWVHGIHFYTARNYRSAMVLLPFCLVLACVLVFFIKETYCRRIEE